MTRAKITAEILQSVKDNTFETLESHYDDIGYSKMFANCVYTLRFQGLVPENLGL